MDTVEHSALRNTQPGNLGKDDNALHSGSLNTDIEIGDKYQEGELLILTLPLSRAQQIDDKTRPQSFFAQYSSSQEPFVPRSISRSLDFPSNGRRPSTW